MYTVKRHDIAKSGKRFCFLFLDSNEYYFNRVQALLLTRADSPFDECAEDERSEARGCEGLLHICSLNLYFEPFDIEQPILKINLRKLERHPSRWTPARWVRQVTRASAARAYSILLLTLVSSAANRADVTRKGLAAARELSRRGGLVG